MRHLFLIVAFVISTTSFAEQKVNTDYFYFLNGETPGKWGWTLRGDGNGNKQIPDEGGKSPGGALTLGPADDAEIPSAIKLKWRRSMNGEVNATIYGKTVDLSKFEHNAEIAMAIKIISRKVPNRVMFKVKCGKTCNAKINIAEQLKKAPTNKWFIFPIALNCISGAGANLSTLSWPFSISTAERFEIHLAEVRVSEMQPGKKGCSE
ncbi:putative glycoside hydrolase [Catenovulum adriaticum]|uniref:Glycoside hydrolase n=1 Tax=Catenovulum adriaticum TaxID=2984846 RepID=A0ABY7AU51_9ALTE|nr:putative glycoside hydrolase [Catenovulum sp. TS8]WAJ71884.1 putative glycoside hydrolase [Catenovulum sp. TS8]